MATFRIHRFGGNFFVHGSADDVRRYVDELNKGRASNLWSAQPTPGLSPNRGVDLAAELAKLQQGSNNGA